MTTDIRIDLRHPTFSPEVAEALALGATLVDACPLDADALMAAACAETGLAAWGDDGFREPFAVLLAALRDEAGLSAMGQVATYTQLLQIVKNRLLVEDVIARHPEVLDIEIDEPIIIAGLPRTGTTHLQNLIAADPALRCLPYWEAGEPVLGAAEAATLGPDDPDPRVVRCDAAMAFLDQALPHFKAMFDVGTHHAHEDINLLALDGSTMFFDTMAPMPSWRAHYRGADQTPHYAYLRRALQVLQFIRPQADGRAGGRTRWILKSPQHLEQFGALIATFPDATVLVTHRDPVAVTASLVTMLTYVGWLSHETIEPERIGAYWAQVIEEMLLGSVRDREVLPPDQSIDIMFGTFMADEPSMLAAIYELARQPLDDRAVGAHAAYLADHGRNRYGRLTYDLADLGLDEADLRARFAPYTERFGVPVESAR